MVLQIQIKDTDLETAWRIRSEVMYPDQPLKRVKLEDDQQGTHLAVYLNNQPVSVISLFNHEGVYQFRKFATLREYQGKGYGSLLLDYVMMLAKKKSATRIWCNARLSACGLYERFGMNPTGDAWEDNGHQYIKMEKQFHA